MLEEDPKLDEISIAGGGEIDMIRGYLQEIS